MRLLPSAKIRSIPRNTPCRARYWWNGSLATWRMLRMPLLAAAEGKHHKRAEMSVCVAHVCWRQERSKKRGSDFGVAPPKKMPRHSQCVIVQGKVAHRSERCETRWGTRTTMQR